MFKNHNNFDGRQNTFLVNKKKKNSSLRNCMLLKYAKMLLLNISTFSKHKKVHFPNAYLANTRLMLKMQLTFYEINIQ